MSPTQSIQLDTLSVAEKLALMERLWADLSRCPMDIPSPDWHGDVLAARLTAAREGKTTFVDWEDAKRRLSDRLK
ncbi:MAG: addiction module protein [Planctomycetaceae bacterium]